ncbi:MAG: Rpn family recombination-promoting nuclease/putative transposase [Treponema sp.]|nr:Rpn family recombination-promoting nuclease/putative transposase [Treponema sp.]
MQENKKFKNNVFTTLFDNPDLLRELYCALEGVSLPQDVPVSINTLENVLYMDYINDISFEIDGKLIVLIEHQSTINPNMALRFLLYITRILEKRIKSETLYSKQQVSIPWPEFFVLYNGLEPFADNATLKLSELFLNPKTLNLPEKSHPLLELEVKVINITEGRNQAILNRCKKLAEYSAFIAKIHAFWIEQENLKEAVKSAIKYCSKHDILKEYLEIHGSEILNMILEEWNTEDAIAYARKEGREMGLEEGCKKGHKEVIDLLSQGLSVEDVKLRLMQSSDNNKSRLRKSLSGS